MAQNFAFDLAISKEAVLRALVCHCRLAVFALTEAEKAVPHRIEKKLKRDYYRADPENSQPGRRAGSSPICCVARVRNFLLVSTLNLMLLIQSSDPSSVLIVENSSCAYKLRVGGSLFKGITLNKKTHSNHLNFPGRTLFRPSNYPGEI